MKYKNHTFVLDTSALLFDTQSLTHFSGNKVVIPVSVLEELDKHKDRLDEVGFNGRVVIRKLHELKKLGNLSKGVLDPESKVTVQLFEEGQAVIPDSLNPDLNDNRILSVAISLSKLKKNKGKIHLVTNDSNLGLKASAFGINSFEFQPTSIYVKSDEYTGYREVEESEDLIINDLYKRGAAIPVPHELKDLNENEYLNIKNSATNQSCLAVYRNGYIRQVNNRKVYNITPLNSEQRFALDLLVDPEIKLVTLTGLAGSGKTLLSVAAGLFQCIEEDPTYDRLVISRSLVVMSGKDKLGFLKGSLKEKLDPYLLPLKDAVDQVIGEGSKGYEYLTATTDGPDNSRSRKPKIEIEPLQYIRGRTLRNVYFIIDEAQNLTKQEVKTIISRAGEGTKIILLGDVDQIDNTYLSKQTNGLTQVIESFKDSKIAGHISLRDGVRSDLATEAAERL